VTNTYGEVLLSACPQAIITSLHSAKRITTDCKINFDIIKKIWTLQIADPSSRQRRRPTETRQQISDLKNIPTGSNIFSQFPQGCSIPRHTDRSSVVKLFRLRQIHPLVREGAPQKQVHKFPTGSNIWSQVPQGCSIPRRTD
jgi:hypothetical protein